MISRRTFLHLNLLAGISVFDRKTSTPPKGSEQQAQALSTVAATINHRIFVTRAKYPIMKRNVVVTIGRSKNRKYPLLNLAYVTLSVCMSSPVRAS